MNNFASLYQQGDKYSLDNDKYVQKVKEMTDFERYPIYLATDDADAPSQTGSTRADLHQA